MPITSYRRTCLILTALACSAVVIAPATPAQACSYDSGLMPFELSDEEPPDDEPNLTAPELSLSSVGRGVASRSGGSSCDDLGAIHIKVAGVLEDVGYRFEIVDGELPDGLGVPSDPRALRGDDITFSWVDGASDDQEPFDFLLVLTPVDPWGREGTPSEPLRVSHPGTSAGVCTIAALGPNAPAAPLWGLAALGLGLVVVRRRPYA